jgi:hypothetical protein
MGVTACNSDDTQTDKVSLEAVEAKDIINGDDEVYYVVPEPAASVNVKTKGLIIVGDLQQLYGTTNGYPQAVIVAKNTLIEGNSQLISDFLKAVEGNKSWLNAESTVISDITTAISTHLPDGTTPSFTEKNLTKSVISNCGINFVSASNDKDRITSYISSISEISSDAVGTMSDEFFYTASETLTTSQSAVSVYMPDGAPALALAQLMAENMQFGNTINYNVVTASTISGYVTGGNPTADICVLPSNLASKLLGSGSTYKLLGTVTNGNLFIMSNNDTQITAQNLSLLQGKTVKVVNLSAVPGLTFRLILSKYNVAYQMPYDI